MNIKYLIIEFVNLIKKKHIEIYNEAALQYELAIFLRVLERSLLKHIA